MSSRQPVTGIVRRRNPTQKTRASSQSHVVYTVSASGQRRRISAKRLVIVIGGHEFEIDFRARPERRAKINVRLLADEESDATLVIGPGDGRQVLIGSYSLADEATPGRL